MSTDTKVPDEVWRVVNVTTMRDYLSDTDAWANAPIWDAISYAFELLTEAGVFSPTLDADHAAALEREKIAAWFEADATLNVPMYDKVTGKPLNKTCAQMIADDIRSGAHNGVAA